MQFSELALNPVLRRGIDHLGFAEPTPIQAATIPVALAGRDLLASAETGSGKTAAFVLPILERMLARPGRGTRALVLTPTRELAAQIHQHLRDLGRFAGITSVTVYGGVGPLPQDRALRGGTNVVIATPGRLLDHVSTGAARLENVEILVLDEADRMLDMGFLPDVKRIIARLPVRRQTMLFSATLPAPIVEMARTMLDNPVRVGVERKQVPVSRISQALLPVPEGRKRELLLEVLRRDEVEMALIFTRTKHRANRLADYLAGTGIACDRIHGNRTQAQREKALGNFRAGRLRVLVATDIASRGIDVCDLPHVINFDVPIQPEDYVHRVGRTARAEKSGTAVTLVAPDEEQAVSAIERAVGSRITRRRLEGFDYGAQPNGRLEIPLADRLKAMRAERSAQRARTAAPRPYGSQRSNTRGADRNKVAAVRPRGAA